MVINGGYPGLRRKGKDQAQVTLRPSGSGSAEKLAFMAPSTALAIRAAPAHFLVKGGEAAAVRAAERIALVEGLLIPLGVVPIVGEFALTAMFVYEVMNYFSTPPVEIPRDRRYYQDVQLVWPTDGSWMNNYYDGAYVETAFANHWDRPADTNERWVDNAAGGGSIPCDYPNHHLWEDFPGYDPLGIVPAGLWPRYKGFTRYVHHDLRDVFPGPGNLVGDTHGLDVIERHIKVRRYGADPAYANPPRMTPGVEARPQIVWVPTFPEAPPYWAIPTIAPNPMRSPHEQTSRGHAPGELDPRGDAPGLEPVTATAPDTINVGGPSTSPPATPAPPAKGEKERKMTVRRNGVVQAIRTVVGEATEFLDALQAFYMALPVQYRPGYYQIHAKNGKLVWVQRWKPSIKQRAEAVYRNFDKLDLNKVWRNVARNEITDRIIGKGSQVIGRASRIAGLTRGLQSGPWDGGFGVDIHKVGGP